MDFSLRMYADEISVRNKIVCFGGNIKVINVLVQKKANKSKVFVQVFDKAFYLVISTRFDK